MRIVAVRLTRLGFVVAVLALLSVFLAVPAVAADGTTPQLVNLFDTAQLLALVGGVLIPFVVASLVNASASDNIKTALAFLATGLTALGTYLTGTDGARTWKGALSVFVIAFVIAAASQKTFTQQWVNKILGRKGLVG